MATFQPILQQVSASPFIAPGVSDNSMATLVAGLGKLGVEAYTGYQEAGLEKDITTTTQDYFTNQRQYEEGQQAGVDAAGVGKGIDAFWDKAATEAADAKDLSLLETKFKSKMETYASAMKQGKMTADQLYARIINTTREHVSRNPWLQKELLKTADDYLEITGLGGYIKTAQKSTKEEQDFQKKFLEERMTRADKLGLNPMSNRNWDAQLTEREAGKAKLESMNLGLQHVKDMLPEDAAKFLEDARPQVYPALWTNLQDTMISQMNTKQANGMPITWEQQKYNIRREALQFKDKLRALVIQNNPRLMGEASVKDFLTHTDQTVDELNKALDTFGSGDDALKFAQNQYNIVKAQQELQVAKMVSLPALNAAGVLMKDMPQGMQMRFMAEHPNAVNMMLSSTAMLLDGTISPINVTHGVKAISGILAVGENRPVPTELGKAITTMAATLRDPKSFPDLKTKVDTQSQLVGQMANVAAKDQFAGMSPADRATTTTVVAEYMDSAEELVNKNIKKLAEEGVNIGWGQLADGTITLQYQEGSKRNDEELARLNAIYPGHMNNAIKAYSHLAGREDYGKVFQNFFLKGGDPNLQPKTSGQGWSASNLTELEKARDAGHITLEQFYQMAEDFVAKSKAANDAPQPIDNSIPTVTSKALLGTEVPPGMNKGASGKITPSAIPLPKGTPIDVKQEQPTVKPVQLAPKLVESPASVRVREALGVGAPKPIQEKIPVYQETSRILDSPKGKWVVFSESKEKIRMYSPVEKIYVDIETSDIPFFEKAFKTPKAQWKKWEK
jgi:hypothetical protein